MFTLYIDTHFINLEMALLKDGKLIDKKKQESNKHSMYTINMLKEMLEDNKLNITDLTEIIVINGPGSFTGVRIGVVIAKIIGFTKNIKIKAISYLQALSLNYEEDITLGIEDKNGIFVGVFNSKHELLEDYFYLTKKEQIEITSKIVIPEDNVDIVKIYQYLKDKESINPQVLKPIYVKKIEVQNDKRS